MNYCKKKTQFIPIYYGSVHQLCGQGKKPLMTKIVNHAEVHLLLLTYYIKTYTLLFCTSETNKTKQKNNKKKTPILYFYFFATFPLVSLRVSTILFGSSVNSNLQGARKGGSSTQWWFKKQSYKRDLKSRRRISTQLASINALIFLSKALFIVKWNKIGTKSEKISKTMKLQKFLYLKSFETSDD